jgi:hypothetical protein
MLNRNWELFRPSLNPTIDGEKSYPRVCLSFSGGGIRSAVYSIGVMKGLHALAGKDGAPFLHQIDIMSGASGGGLGYHLSPFPFYFFNRAYMMDLYGESIYLSDGGHSENLAAFPLVRRVCENIILVDAEYDPNYTFEAYFKLKESLGRELSVSTTLDPQPAHLNLKGSIDDIDTAIEKQRTLDNVNDSDWIAPITKQYFSGRQPVMSGTISTIPLTLSSSVIRKDLKLTSIKLALDEEEFRNITGSAKEALTTKYGKEVVTYVDSVLTNDCELRPRVFAWIKECAFPHYPTTYQNYAESQFDAYVKLGECIVLNHLDYDATRQSVAVRATPRNRCSAS